jgi:hypothetical protein
MRALLDFEPLVAHITPRAALYVSCCDTFGNLAGRVRPPPSQPGINEQRHDLAGSTAGSAGW